MVALYEKYRPRKFSEVVGQERPMKRLLCLQKTTGLQGQVIALTGDSGTGKTTIARLIAEKVACDMTIWEIDALKLDTETIDDWEYKAKGRPLSFNGENTGWAFVINEFHNLSSKMVSRLQTILEDPQVQQFSTWIFTTTSEGEQRLFGSRFDAYPFLSRAVRIELNSGENTQKAFAQRVMEIAQAEGVDGRPLEAYVALAEEHRCNFRSMLQYVASGGML